MDHKNRAGDPDLSPIHTVIWLFTKVSRAHHGAGLHVLKCHCSNVHILCGGPIYFFSFDSMCHRWDVEMVLSGCDTGGVIPYFYWVKVRYTLLLLSKVSHQCTSILHFPLTLPASIWVKYLYTPFLMRKFCFYFCFFSIHYPSHSKRFFKWQRPDSRDSLICCLFDSQVFLSNL